MLVKPSLESLWKCHQAIDQVLTLKSGLKGTIQTAILLRKQRFDTAYILPHSFRSALIPFLAGIPQRIGMPGHSRDFMLTNICKPLITSERYHQAYEYIDLLSLSGRTYSRASGVCGRAEARPSREAFKDCEHITEIPRPTLSIPDEIIEKIQQLLNDLPHPLIGFIPGAARGPSKQWPLTHFEQLGRMLTHTYNAGIILFGGHTDTVMCEKAAISIGPDTLNLAGRTTLLEWAALLQLCDLVITNDSGGMHIAAAVDTPVIALFGITDPEKTGPLGRHIHILQKSPSKHRDIKRYSAEGIKWLKAISPEEVFTSAQHILNGT